MRIAHARYDPPGPRREEGEEGSDARDMANLNRSSA